MASEKPLPYPGAATFLAFFPQAFFRWGSQQQNVFFGYMRANLTSIVMLDS
jgi:hypothetical protein